MARTSPSDVATIFDTDLSEAAGDSLDTWINIASELVDDIASADSSIGSTRLEQIEKLLAAHLASAQDPRLEGYSVGGSSGSYQGETGMHITSTHYGQQAAALDPTGTLAGMGKPSASITAPDVKGLDD